MGAIKHQGIIADSERLSSRYGGVPVIYVESEEDRHVFGDCWFRDRLSKVEFQPASTSAALPGCNGVIAAVSEELQGGNAAWGIVDRDTVMAHDNWALVHETDDSVYEANKPFGDNIKALCRWEMESYLVDAEALEHHLACIEKKLPRSLPIVYQELLDHCQALVPHAAINAVFHYHRQKGLGDGETNQFTSRNQVDGYIQSTKFPKLPTTVASEYAQHLARVEAFDYPGLPTEDRVKGLLRRVHGKAVLQRFQYAHKIQRTELDGLLAKRIEEKGRVPAEIDNFITQVAATC